MSPNKLFTDAHQALAGLPRDGMTVMAGGFGPCGVPAEGLRALLDSGVRDLTLIAIDCGLPGQGIGPLIEHKRLRHLIVSYTGENPAFAEQYKAGTVTVEFCPQGTLVERMRAGGAGIPAFYTPTGAGTDAAHGKESRLIDGRECLLETALTADLGFVKAWRGDAVGNLVFRKTARNSNPLVAMASRATLAEVEEILPVGAIDGDAVHTPSLFVTRLFPVNA